MNFCILLNCFPFDRNLITTYIKTFGTIPKWFWLSDEAKIRSHCRCLLSLGWMHPMNKINTMQTKNTQIIHGNKERSQFSCCRFYLNLSGNINKMLHHHVIIPSRSPSKRHLHQLWLQHQCQLCQFTKIYHKNKCTLKCSA